MSDFSNKFNRDINSPLIKKSIFILLDKSSTKILLVEGEGDKPFYSKYVSSSVIISEVVKTKNYYNEKNGKHDPDYIPKHGRTAKDFLQFIIDKHQKNIKKDKHECGACYGIVDKDYDGIDTNNYPDMGSYITCTDQRDLETTLIALDRLNVEQRFEDDFKSNGGSFSILKKSIDSASQIGKVRFLREAIKTKPNNFRTRQVSIEFKKNEFAEDSKTRQDGYYRFIKNGSFEISDYLNFNNGQNVDAIISDISQLNEDNLSYCRGHDIFDFVACFYKIANPSLSWKSLTKITALREKYESYLKEEFFINDVGFRTQSQIYKFLEDNKLTKQENG